MKIGREQEKKFLLALLVILAGLVIYRISTHEEQRAVELVYKKGAVATSSIRGGVSSDKTGTEPLAVYMQRRNEKYPGVLRDVFKMSDRSHRPVSAPTPTQPIGPPAPPPPPEKTLEEVAAETARTDLSKFRFLGFLTDKDSSLFLSKDGENYIVKSGDTVLKDYMVKEAGKDYVILLDTVTKVEVRIELTGGAEQPPQSAPAPPMQRFR